jgi:hypothetical protein
MLGRNSTTADIDRVTHLCSDTIDKCWALHPLVPRSCDSTPTGRRVFLSVTQWLSIYSMEQLYCLVFVVPQEPGSSLSTLSDYILDGRDSIPGGGKDIFLYPLCPDQLWGPPSLLSNGYQGPFRGVMRAGVTLTTPSQLGSGKKMNRSCNSSPLLHMHGGSGTALLFFLLLIHHR